MKLHVPIKLRWSDLDAYGHVNNAAMLTLLEESRISVFWNGGALGVEGLLDAAEPLEDGAPAQTLTLIARQEVEYLAPIPYLRDPLDVQLWIGRMGGASLDVCYEVCSPQGADPFVLYARAASSIVLVDSATMRPRRMTDGEREGWSTYLDAPVVFANRS
ncbi:MAG TPA: thioesterase family protein [Pseudolysinimonas sp.]|jgi:acyl-CoA thioester hydrolase|nr:4-hydroxybenzoyl-CoA thioesterase [Schumannella sp.]HEV7741703.1 thioesterase family protein [Pseudolysinimonas sp.]